jgi:hypothetical protein
MDGSLVDLRPYGIDKIMGYAVSIDIFGSGKHFKHFPLVTREPESPGGLTDRTHPATISCY